MTYYGRWTYKYEIAAKQGRGRRPASSTRPARPAIRSRSSQGKTGEKFDLVTPDENVDRVAVEGWITLDQAKELFTRAGPGLRPAQGAARATRDFRRSRSASPRR